MGFVTDTYGLSVQNSGYCHIINNISYSIYNYCVKCVLHKPHNRYKYCVIHNNCNKMKQELTTSKQIVEAEQRFKRMGKGRVIAQSRRIYRLLQTDVFYVESESTDNIYYFVKFKPDVVEWCSCPDNSMRGQKCKHIWSIEFAIRMETLRDIPRLPTEAKVSKVTASAAKVSATLQAKVPRSYQMTTILFEKVIAIDDSTNK